MELYGYGIVVDGCGFFFLYCDNVSYNFFYCVIDVSLRMVVIFFWIILEIKG